MTNHVDVSWLLEELRKADALIQSQMEEIEQSHKRLREGGPKVTGENERLNEHIRKRMERMAEDQKK